MMCKKDVFIIYVGLDLAAGFWVMWNLQGSYMDKFKCN